MSTRPPVAYAPSKVGRVMAAVAWALIAAVALGGCQRGAPTPAASTGWSDSVWQAADLTSASGGPMAVLAGTSAYVYEVQGTQHVLHYAFPDNHIRELWWDTNGRHSDDLTAVTGAPPASGSTLLGYAFETQGTEHVIYVGADRHIYELWWKDSWHVNDLTAATGTPVAGGEALAGYVLEGEGTEHVFYSGYDRHVYELWWDRDGWHGHDLTAATGAPPITADALTGYAFEARGTRHVIYGGAGGHIHDLWADDNGWHTDDLTTATGAAAFGGRTMVGYVFRSQGTEHVIYGGVAGHLHELWADQNGWHTDDLTAATGGEAFGGGTLTAYAFESRGTEHVIYSGRNRHLYELWGNGRWHASDLTRATGAPAAGSGTLAGYVFEAQGTQHVIYGSTADAHIHELVWGPGAA